MSKSLRFEMNNITLVGLFYGKVRKEFDRLINEEFKEVFEKFDVKPIVRYADRDAILWNNGITPIFVGKKTTATFEELRDVVFNSAKTACRYPMMASYKGHFKDDKLKIEGLKILINLDAFKEKLIMNIEHLDLVEQFLKISIRHEVGHLMDYISYDGVSKKDIEAMRDENNVARDKYYKKFFDDTGVKADVDETERLTYYYAQIPCEASANELADVDLQELLRLENALMYNTNDYSIDVEIITHRAEEIPKESDHQPH